MKKLLFVLIILAMGLQTFAQTKIQMRSADKAECVKSDMKSLQATFSFSGIEARLPCRTQSSAAVRAILRFPL